MRVRLLLPVLAAVSLCSTAAAAPVVVPDQHATITAAIATGADTVLVRDGSYPEVVTLARPLVLARFDLDGPPASRPQLTGLLLTTGPQGWAHVEQFHIAQNVPLTTSFNGPDLWLDACVLDSGISRGASLGPRLRMTGCEVTGDVDVFQWSFEITGNRFTGGGLNADYEAFGTLSSNWITGAAGFAITLRDNDSGGEISDNVIWNCGAGIRVDDPSGTLVERNLVEHCTGSGVHTERLSQGGTARIFDNVLRDLGGDGVSVGSVGAEVVGNQIERVAGAGIRIRASAIGNPVAGNRVTDSGEAGILTDTDGFLVGFVRNTILRANGPGAVLRGTWGADSNVVGRCRGDGIVASAPMEPLSLAHNTLYLNEGSGLVVNSPLGGVVRSNIGYGNGLHALDWTGSGEATLSCNLGFGNRAGNVRGAVPGESDRDGDPLFCNLPADDVHLGPGTAAIYPGCETAGALGPGCASSAGVGPGPGVALLRVGPQPARAGVRFEWTAAAPVCVELFDATGARRWERSLAGGPATFAWDLRDERGQRLAPGVYFVRATSAGRTTHARLVVAR